jgi:hypothetical protein
MPTTRRLAGNPIAPNMPADAEFVAAAERGAEQTVSLVCLLSGNGLEQPPISTGEKNRA